MLKTPTVISLQNVGNGEHQVESTAVVAAAGDSGALQGIGELEQIELRQPVALLKGSQGVILPARNVVDRRRWSPSRIIVAAAIASSVPPRQ